MAWKIPRSSSMIWEMIFAADHVSLNGKPWVFHISLLVYRVIPCSLRNQSWQWKIHQHPQSKWTKCSCENHRTKWGIVELSSHVWLPDGIWKIGYSIPEFSDQFINHPQTSRDPVLKVIDQFLSRKPWVFHISLAYPISEISCACPCRAEISPFFGWPVSDAPWVLHMASMSKAAGISRPPLSPGIGESGSDEAVRPRIFEWKTSGNFT